MAKTYRRVPIRGFKGFVKEGGYSDRLVRQRPGADRRDKPVDKRDK